MEFFAGRKEYKPSISTKTNQGALGVKGEMRSFRNSKEDQFA